MFRPSTSFIFHQCCPAVKACAFTDSKDQRGEGKGCRCRGWWKEDEGRDEVEKTEPQNPAKLLVPWEVLGNILWYLMLLFRGKAFWGMDEWNTFKSRWKSHDVDLFRKTKIWNKKLWRHDMMAMEQVVARENPLTAVWNLWIDNWWLMDHASLASWWNPGSIIQPTAQRFLFSLHKTPRKKKTVYEWVVQSISLPQKVCLCQGRQPLEVGTVCQAEWIWGKWCLKGWG